VSRSEEKASSSEERRRAKDEVSGCEALLMNATPPQASATQAHATDSAHASTTNRLVFLLSFKSHPPFRGICETNCEPCPISVLRSRS